MSSLVAGILLQGTLESISYNQSCCMKTATGSSYVFFTLSRPRVRMAATTSSPLRTASASFASHAITPRSQSIGSLTTRASLITDFATCEWSWFALRRRYSAIWVRLAEGRSRLSISCNAELKVMPEYRISQSNLSGHMTRTVRRYPKASQISLEMCRNRTFTYDAPANYHPTGSFSTSTSNCDNRKNHLHGFRILVHRGARS